MNKRQPSPLDVIEARVRQLAAALAVLAPKVRDDPGAGGADSSAKAPDAAPPAGEPDAGALRGSSPPANDPRSSGP